MLIPELDLPHVSLSPGQDAELARAVEAGVYAQHLIEEGATDPRLPEVAARGRWAAEQFAWVGIRMALKYALRTAHLSGLPQDELFQDGCVAVGEAIRHYDYTHNFRFTTFVYEYLYRELCDAGRHRLGHPLVSRADRRAALAADGSAAAQRGSIRQVSLDELTASELAVPTEPEKAGTDFLALLLPLHRRLLRLRYGLGGPARTQRQAAAELGVSPSSVCRWEQEALEAARQVLSGERTTTAAAYRRAAAVG